MIKVFAVLGVGSFKQQLLQNLQKLLSNSRLLELHKAAPPNAAACLCCQLHNETSDALRELFMQALHKQLVPFSSVLINCFPAVDASSVRYTVGQDFFLKARYQWQGTFLAIDRDFVKNLFAQTGVWGQGKEWQQRDKTQINRQLAQNDLVLDMTLLMPWLPYFSACDVGIYSADAFLDKLEQQIFQHMMQQIYAHLQIFQPDLPLMRLLSIHELDEQNLQHLQQQWQQNPVKTKRHLFAV